METIKYMEFYAGIGTGSFVARESKFNIETLGFSEINPHASKLYINNHGNIKNFGDITKINISEIPELDFISGGFPCQDVSTAGKMDLKIGRSATVFKLIEIIKKKTPKYLFLENVRGVLSADNGEFFPKIIRELKQIGYAISYKLVNSNDYGTPQSRNRVLICGLYKGQEFGFNPFPTKKEYVRNIQDLIEKNVDDKYYLTERQIEYAKQYSIKKNKTWGNNIIKTKSNCLMAQNPKRLIHDSPLVKDSKGLRVLTPRECFRIMGFFDDEIELGDLSDTQLYQMAGNAWEKNLISQVFEKLLSY